LDGEVLPKNILFTGLPGCGKSTIIAKIVQRLNRPSTGFFTREMRDKGRRVGFSITTLDGRRGILAHIDIRSAYKVGKYRVNLQDIDKIAVPAMIPASENLVIVVDEIGKMECFSMIFRQTLIKVLDASNPVIGSIALKGNAFISTIKKRPDIRLIPISERNRNILAKEILERLTNLTGSNP
jgi:nucleoside-triphosphatase